MEEEEADNPYIKARICANENLRNILKTQIKRKKDDFNLDKFQEDFISISKPFKDNISTLQNDNLSSTKIDIQLLSNPTSSYIQDNLLSDYTKIKTSKQIENDLKQSILENEKEKKNNVKIYDDFQSNLVSLNLNNSDNHSTINEVQTIKNDSSDNNILLLNFPTIGLMKSNKNFPFLQRLELECRNLIAWLSPTPLEKFTRNMVFYRIELLSKAIWNGCSAQIFGSCFTDLSLPDADIDICILNVPGNILMNLKLFSFLLSHLKMAQGIEVISSAKVPILKFIEIETGFLVDISINQSSSTSTTEFLSRKLVEFQHLRPLIMLIKFFLKLRGLNETYSGGVGSFLLSLMVLNFLQLHPSSVDPFLFKHTLLSQLFIDFFFEYGYQRNLKMLACSVRGLGHLFPRASRPSFEYSPDILFSVEHPLEIDIDLGSSSFNSRIVKDSFQKAFLELTSHYFPSKIDENQCSSILSCVFDQNHPLFHFRPHHETIPTSLFSNLRKEVCKDLYERINIQASKLKNNFQIKLNSQTSESEDE